MLTLRVKNRFYWWLLLLVVAILLAVIANGVLFWLRKVGFVDWQYYQYFIQTWPGYPQVAPGEAGNQQLAEFTRALYVHPQEWAWLKRVKDGVMLGALLLLAVGYVGLQRKARAQQPFVRCRWAADCSLAKTVMAGTLAGVLAVALVGVMAAYSWWVNGIWYVLAGTYALGFVAVGFMMTMLWQALVTAQHRLPSRQFLVDLLLLGLVMQTLLVSVELYQGMHLFHALPLGLDWHGRVVGSFLQPASFGVSMVMCAAFIQVYSHAVWQQRLAWALVLPLVWLSGSAMALVLFAVGIAVFGGRWLWYRLKHRQERCLVAVPAESLVTFGDGRRVFKWVAIAVGIVGCVVVFAWLLPGITGRFDVLESLVQRGDLLVETLDGQPLGVWLFGGGLGTGTNAVQRFLPAGSWVYSDSTWTVLFLQFGLMGVISVAIATLRWLHQAYFKSRQQNAVQPATLWQDEWLLWVLLLIASFTLNITELFPVNVLLGWLMARAVIRGCSAND